MNLETILFNWIVTFYEENVSLGGWLVARSLLRFSEWLPGHHYVVARVPLFT